MSFAQIESILTRLSQGKIDFVIVGGVAAWAHGSARVTFDLDVCYRRDFSNVERLCNVLAPLRPTLRGAPLDLPFKLDVSTVMNGLNFTLTTDLGPLDLLGEVAGLGEYEAAQTASETTIFYGFSMQVLTLEGLLKAKRAAGRPKDQEAIIELEALLEMRQRPPGEPP